MPRYVDEETLRRCLSQLQGTAGTLFRIWLTLKHMGLESGSSVSITTTNPTTSLVRLFGCGHPDGRLYTPVASIPSDRFMNADAGRSIIQTTVRQWFDGSGVYSPTELLSVKEGPPEGRAQPLVVSTKRGYPEGLGRGKEGFAHAQGKRVSIPRLAFAVWYGRQSPITDESDPATYLLAQMRRELHLSPAEDVCIFVERDLPISTSPTPLDDASVYRIIRSLDEAQYTSVEIEEPIEIHRNRVRSMQTTTQGPPWLASNPEDTLREVLVAGAKAVLLYGPPRTGKTRAIDSLFPRNDPRRTTIQIHDGWGYEQLVQGYRPKADQSFGYELGSLTQALEDGKEIIVLEEINRTLISQSIGEVFSLIEEAYRGESNKIFLRDNSPFWIDANAIFFLTMNTVDKSTEDVDDALIGRLTCVEFPPRVESLAEMLVARGTSPATTEKMCRLFAQIQGAYPLGHGYFAEFGPTTNPILFYKTRIRPVLRNHLQHHKALELATIDNMVDELFPAQ